MVTKKTAINKAKKFLAECAQIPVKIDRAILFGSVVSGKAKKDSDIDLALFSTMFSDNILTNLDLIGSVNIHFPEIEVHTYPLKDLNRNRLMIDEIKKTGIVIQI